ncbi:MAG: RagB/SusD family nutrient uptake outer membrane protein [Prevotella sp.]|nr:RagB/SusD family nutrient uptake outer membrane protein [Prevotella sp.]
MKRIQYIVAGILACTLYSCNLEENPYSEIVSNSYVKDSSSVNNLLVGCYNGLHDVMYREWAVTELRSDNARMYATNSTSNTSKLVEQLDQNTIGAEHEWVADYWDAAYAEIERCNNVIRNLDVMPESTLRNKYQGEALFLRSLEYFNLVRLWGPVFIVTSKTSPSTARNMQRSTVEDVYQLIESDLEHVVNDRLLPEKEPTDDIGRADLNSARALLAKVYATHYKVGDEKYAQAVVLCKQVLQSVNVGDPQSAADLVPYADIFSTSNEMSKEIIFAVRYKSGNVGLGSPFGNFFAPINNGANVIVGTSNNFNTPSDNLINQYIEEGDSIRMNTCIAQRYYNAVTDKWTDAVYCKKYTTPVTTEFDGESDWPVIRVGDIALLYAELSNELNGPSAEALNYLNMIRQRAGISPYKSSDLSNKYDFRTAVRKERRMELAFEDQRWFDLLRWNVATQTINNYLATDAFYTGYSYTVQPIQEWQTMLPIPVSVLDINPKASQNVGY